MWGGQNYHRPRHNNNSEGNFKWGVSYRNLFTLSTSQSYCLLGLQSGIIWTCLPFESWFVICKIWRKKKHCKISQEAVKLSQECVLQKERTGSERRHLGEIIPQHNTLTCHMLHKRVVGVWNCSSSPCNLWIKPFITQRHSKKCGTEVKISVLKCRRRKWAWWRTSSKDAVFSAAEDVNGMTACDRPNLHAAHMFAPSPDRPFIPRPWQWGLSACQRDAYKGLLIMMSLSVC